MQAAAFRHWPFCISNRQSQQTVAHRHTEREKILPHRPPSLQLSESRNNNQFSSRPASLTLCPVRLIQGNTPSVQEGGITACVCYSAFQWVQHVERFHFPMLCQGNNLLETEARLVFFSKEKDFDVII